MKLSEVFGWIMMNTLGRAFSPMSRKVTKRDSSKEVEKFEKRRAR